MTKEQVESAIRWFAGRYVHTNKGKRFMLRSHGLEDMTVDQKKKLAHRRGTNRQWELAFLKNENHLNIVPAFPESEWARGQIMLTEGDTFIYISHTLHVPLGQTNENSD